MKKDGKKFNGCNVPGADKKRWSPRPSLRRQGDGDGLLCLVWEGQCCPKGAQCSVVAPETSPALCGCGCLGYI